MHTIIFGHITVQILINQQCYTRLFDSVILFNLPSNEIMEALFSQDNSPLFHYSTIGPMH